MSVSRAAAARGAAGVGSAKIDDRSSGAAARAPSASSVSVVEGLSDRRSDRPDLETSWSPPRCTRDRALTGGEAAPLDEPWRASHRRGHDDAKALLQPHRHVISRGSRRTGDAELFAGGVGFLRVKAPESGGVAITPTALPSRCKDLHPRYLGIPCRAAATAAWASSTVLRWGNTRPYTPLSSACLITHWLRSRAFGGIRTIGTTSGCRLPFSAILLRFSSTCREVRRVVKLKPSCSISMMTA